MEKEILKKNLLRTVLYLVYFIFFLNFAAIYFSWYWTIPWLDMAMHFLGGFWVISFLYWLYLFTPLSKFATRAIFLVLGLILISLAWELLEFTLDRTGGLGVTLPDSLSDLMLDFLGGVAAYFYLKWKHLWQA